MSFKLEEVTLEAEFDEIWPTRVKAYLDPYNSFAKLFNPIHTTLEATIESSKARNIRNWEADPNCHWVKVTDISSGNFVGAVCWALHEKAKEGQCAPKPFNAYWHIEGSDEKLLTEKLIVGLNGYVKERMKGPYIGLDIMFVHTDYRKHGVGRLMIEEVTRKADALGLEMVVVAVPYARPVYEKCGFRLVGQIDVDFMVPTPSDKWKELLAEDMRAFMLWRPTGRDYHEGDVLPQKTTLMNLSKQML